MIGPVYSKALSCYGLSWKVPGEEDRDVIDRRIFGKLVNGIFREETGQEFYRVVETMKRRGCDAVVPGCTEISLLVKPSDCPLPVLDSTRLLARAALDEALA